MSPEMGIKTPCFGFCTQLPRCLIVIETRASLEATLTWEALALSVLLTSQNLLEKLCG